jgi:hypothetical protein
MNYCGTLILIPTRNRADLAANAIRSALSEDGGEVAVLVSDNSTSVTQRSELAQFCKEIADDRLDYITPPEPLPMTQHWDWALRQALALHDVSHISFLTDRMMFKPDALRSLIQIIAAYPDKILTYMHDIVDDFATPIAVRQYAWTGDLYQVSSTSLLELSARSVMYDCSFPRMLNCIVPRDVLHTIQSHFGNLFASVSPDWNFAYRALAVLDSVLLYDKAALVHYAQFRSNGQSVHHGIKNEAFNDFIRDLGTSPINSASPYPEIVTIWNAIINEYCQVREVTQSPKFPEVDLDKYRSALAWGINQIKDPTGRAEMRKLLSARAPKPDEVAANPARPSTQVPLSETKAPAIEKFGVNTIEFPTSEEALNYALMHPRERSAASTHKSLIHGIEVPLPDGI